MSLEFFSLFLKFSFPLAYSQLASFIQTSHSVSVSSQFHFQSALELKKKKKKKLSSMNNVNSGKMKEKDLLLQQKKKLRAAPWSNEVFRAGSSSSSSRRVPVDGHFLEITKTQCV